jgi:DNA-3-methyladenine glycosylase I
VGPTSVYAFMQNVGVVNDHVHGCFRATDYPASDCQDVRPPG